MATLKSACGVMALSALALWTALLSDAHAQRSSGPAQRAAVRQPLDGPNVVRNRDAAAGAMLDSLIDPVIGEVPRETPATRALGGAASKASIRPEWTARLARNPRPDDGNPPYVLIDRYGGIQRYVEPSPRINLEAYVGKSVAVRRDTGHTLLASQLDLPRSAPQKSSTGADGDLKLASFDEAVESTLEPTPAEAPPSAAGAPEMLPPQSEMLEGEMIEGEGPFFDEHGHPMSMHGDVDPLYLDAGPQFAGCDSCGSSLCRMQGGCGYGSRPIFYARGEYLLWDFDGMDTPPLVVRGEVNDNGTPANVADDFFDNAFIVFGNEDILDETRSGGRVRLGYWLDDYGRWAIEGDYLGFGQVETQFVDGGDGTFPIVGRPFTDATTGYPAVEDVSFPGIMGTVTINADSMFQSAGLRFRRNLCCVSGQPDCGDAVACGTEVGCATGLCGSPVGSDAPLLQFFKRGTRHMDVTYGVRWAQLREGLDIVEDLTVIAPSDPADVGTTFLVNDSFSTSNDFVGGELGYHWDWQHRRWSLEFLTKLAIGNTRQRVRINGSTVATAPGDPSETGVGGLLAQGSNIGNYERNELSVLPEIGMTVGYMLTDRLKLTGGYTFLYWSRVVRPGDQIDLEVNPGNLPFADPADDDGLPDRPTFVFRDTDFWGHGMNVGLEYIW